MSERVQGVMKQYNISVPEPPEFFQNITGFPFDFDFGGNETRRGVVAHQRGLRPKHPIVIVPGAAQSKVIHTFLCVCGCTAHMGYVAPYGRAELDAVSVVPQASAPVRLEEDDYALHSLATHCSACAALSTCTMREDVSQRPRMVGVGFVTTGLELWAALPCAVPSFRLRLWGTMKMPQVLPIPYTLNPKSYTLLSATLKQ